MLVEVVYDSLSRPNNCTFPEKNESSSRNGTVTHQTPIHAHWRHKISDNSTTHISISVHCAELTTYLNLSYCKPCDSNHTMDMFVIFQSTHHPRLLYAKPQSTTFRSVFPCDNRPHLPYCVGRRHVFRKLNILNSAEHFKTISIFCNIQLFIPEKRLPSQHLWRKSLPLNITPNPSSSSHDNRHSSQFTSIPMSENS